MTPWELRAPKSRLPVGWRSQEGRRWADLKGPDQSADFPSIPPSLPNWYFLSFTVSLECVPRADLGTSLVVKNLPSNAGDEGLIPGGGTKIPRASGELLSP